MKQRPAQCMTQCLIWLACGSFWFSAAALPAEGLLIYKPPAVGAPSARSGGGTRALMADLPLRLLTPTGIGWTSRASPILYWYSGKTGDQVAEIALIRQDDNQTLLEKTLSVQRPGIQRIRLGDYGLSLPAGTVCRWSMALTADRSGSSSDWFADGAILYQPSDTATMSAAEFAEKGYWYDALAKLLENGAGGFSDQLEALLEQGGVALPPGAMLLN